MVMMVVILQFRTVAAADGDIVISEVVYNSICLGTTESTCGTTGSTETRFEWVEIYNQGVSSVIINGWQLCDNNGCDMLPDGEIYPGEYWVIAYNATALQTEFNQYSPAFAVIESKTLAVNHMLGGRYGLSNETDHIYLQNTSNEVVHCVSWGSDPNEGSCSGMDYVEGGSGFDTDLNDAQDGQSITNVQGAWYKHGYEDGPKKASPYGQNTGVGGPTAIGLVSFSANSDWNWTSVFILGIGMGLVGIYRIKSRRSD